MQPNNVMQWKIGEDDLRTGSLRNLYVTKINAIDPTQQKTDTHSNTNLETTKRKLAVVHTDDNIMGALYFQLFRCTH